MMRVAATHVLHLGGMRMATCQQLPDGRWFWYGEGVNTCNTPTDLVTAKQEAKAYIQTVLKNRRTHQKTQIP